MQHGAVADPTTAELVTAALTDSAAAVTVSAATVAVTASAAKISEVGAVKPHHGLPRRAHEPDAGW